MRALRKEFDDLKKECRDEVGTWKNRIECLEAITKVLKKEVLELKRKK